MQGDILMSDRFHEMEPRRGRPARSGSGRALSAILLLFVCAIVAAVIRENFGEFSALYQITQGQPSAPATQASFATASQVSVASAQPIEELRQLVQNLQASLQQATDKLDVTQRQLASEQGERQLLSQQVGALSARVSALSASNASVASAAAPALPKKKPVLPPVR
jgi:uncharacterized protein HemX